MLQIKDTEWLNGYKNKICIYAAYSGLTSDLKTQKTENEGMEKAIPCKWKSKVSQGTNTYIRQNDKIIKTVNRDKEGQYIMKGSIQEEDITIINIYVPNIGGTKYIKQILMDIKGEIHSNTIIVEDFNTPLTSMDRSSRQKINKETLALNDTLDQMDFLRDIEHSI